MRGWGSSLLVVSTAVLTACALDSTGADPPSSAGSASSGDATGSTSGGAGTPSATASTGEGAGPGSTGQGGDTTSGGGSPATGGGGQGGGSGGDGTGAGGDGGQGGGSGGAGGEGGSGPVDEWLKRVHGNNNQTVNDVVVGRGGFVYVVGTATWDDVKVDGDETVRPIADGDDVFAAKIAADGSSVAWFVSFGGGGDDRGMSIAIGRDGNDVERLYIAGTAQGEGNDADLFVPGTDPPGNDWGFVMELSAATGSALGGTVWGNVNRDHLVDVTTLDGVAYAVGTCNNNCADWLGATNQGQDVIVARYPFDDDDDAWQTRLISRPGDQRGIAIAADPTTDGFAILGEMRETSYDPGLGIAPSECEVTGRGGVDGFVATYAFGSIDFVCETAVGVGSAQDDQAHALAFDGTNAFTALTLGGDDLGQVGGRGTYVVATKEGEFSLAAQLTTANNSNAFALVLDGGDLAIAGRVDDRGYVRTMAIGDGVLGVPRSFIDSFNQARGLAISGQQWFVGGVFDGTVDFGFAAGGGGSGGGGLGPVASENARDGWIARMNRP